MEINKIYKEDCLETMARMPDDFADLSFTSPPYNMNLRVLKGKYCSRQILKEEFSTKYSEFSDNLPIDEFYNLHKKILGELIRVSKIVFYNISIVTGSKRAFFKLMGDYSNNIKEFIIWDKGHAQPAMHNNVLNRQHELILVLEKENKSINRMFDKCNFTRGSLNDIWLVKKSRKSVDGHKATFPEELVSKVLVNFTNKNDLVYDCFSGTGTTAYVCKQLDRNYIGSEISQKYYDVSNKRLSV